MIMQSCSNSFLADRTNSKLQISRYSCWRRLFRTMFCSYTVRHTQYDRLSVTATAELLVTVTWL